MGREEDSSWGVEQTGGREGQTVGKREGREGGRDNTRGT